MQGARQPQDARRPLRRATQLRVYRAEPHTGVHEHDPQGREGDQVISGQVLRPGPVLLDEPKYQEAKGTRRDSRKLVQVLLNEDSEAGKAWEGLKDALLEFAVAETERRQKNMESRRQGSFANEVVKAAEDTKTQYNHCTLQT